MVLRSLLILSCGDRDKSQLGRSPFFLMLNFTPFPDFFLIPMEVSTQSVRFDAQLLKKT